MKNIQDEVAETHSQFGTTEQANYRTKNYDKICSGCGKEHQTVDRFLFDGLCADCTDKALYDSDFEKKAKSKNKELILKNN